MIDRKEFLEELALRENIRKILRKKLRKLNEATSAASTPDAPYDITAMNFLSTLVNEILKKIETAYKSLMTSPDQRQSYAAHILNGINDQLELANANPEADTEDKIVVDEEIDITVADDGEIDPFDEEGIIDIRNDEEPEDSEEEKFGSALAPRGLDMTGRNEAYATFKQISPQIIAAYTKIDPDSIVPAEKVKALGVDTPEREVFKIYLLKNLDLYMRQFEDELAGTPEIPDIPV